MIINYHFHPKHEPVQTHQDPDKRISNRNWTW